jgi:hypothetical protein
MSYGQILERRAMMKISFQSQKGNKNMAGEIAMANKMIQIFEFRQCVVEHNLERVEGELLNLSNEADVTSLDPKVGQEIEKFIEGLNNFDEDGSEAETQGNSTGE